MGGARSFDNKVKKQVPSPPSSPLFCMFYRAGAASVIYNCVILIVKYCKSDMDLVTSRPSAQCSLSGLDSRVCTLQTFISAVVAGHYAY